MKSVRTADGTVLQVLDRGQGLPLVFLHAFPLDHSMWSAQIERFSGQCRVIALDQRGFGGSQPTPGTVSMEQMADDLASVLDSLEVSGPVVLCGLSMGGYVAWQFWRKYAQRLQGLVLCNTRAKPDTTEARQMRFKMIEHVEKAGTVYVADAMLPRLFASSSFTRLPGAVEFVRERILLTSPVGITAALRGIADRPDMTDQMPNVQVSALVIASSEDAITPAEEMRRFAALMPRAEVVELSGVGHLSALEAPVEFNTALARFLARQIQPSAAAK